MKKIVKKITWLAGIMAILCLALMLICNQIVVNNATGKVLPEECSDKDILEYPGFDKVWAKHNENLDWYPDFD